MPSTTYNIDRIMERVPNASREAVREVLNEVQLIVYSQDCLQTTKLSSNGMPPYLVTTDDVYEYACPADCRRTAMIFAAGTPKGYTRQRPVGPRKEYYFRNKGFYPLGHEQRDASIDAVARVFLTENPGTTTEQYYHLYYLKATPIDSEEIQLTLPEETHWLLRKAVVAMLTTEEYGESQFDSNVMEKIARKIRNSLNKGLQGNSGQTPIPEEYQDFPTFYNGVGF